MTRQGADSEDILWDICVMGDLHHNCVSTFYLDNKNGPRLQIQALTTQQLYEIDSGKWADKM